MVFSNPNEDRANEENQILKENAKNSYVNDLAVPNPLFKFASVNYLFTLSCLGQEDLTNTKTLLTAAPHDIIIRSSGLGGDTNSTVAEGFMPTADKIIKSGIGEVERKYRTAERVKTVFDKPRDIYFKSVTMNSIPPNNQERSFTSVTSINMEIVEPQGITLLDRIRAGAANNGYFDHLDAPYLLTMEFIGFDEKTQMPLDNNELKNLKRVIPIKLVDMNLDVNQGGSIYSCVAIPYNEFGFSNTYLYPRTSGSVVGETIEEACQSITQILNNQTLDEAAKNLVDLPDEYSVTVDSAFKNTPFEFSSIRSTGFQPQDVPPSQGFKTTNTQQIVKFNTNNSILTVLKEICRASPQFGNKEFKKWEKKVKYDLTRAQINSGNQGVYDASQDQSMYFMSYKISTTITPLKGWANWDQKRQTHKKKIGIHISPHYIHAYSLSIPGVSTGQKFKNFVHKKYNYIFTGDNVDVLNLDINYRLAYFQSRLKDVEADSRAIQYRSTPDSKEEGPRYGDDFVQDGSHIVKHEVGTVKSSGDKTAESFFLLDQLQDELSNPLADMVNVQMEILGDPAWISQSQFIPLELFNSEPGRSGRAEVKNMDYWQGGKNLIWNDKFKCYNTDVADPVILLNFRMPSDLDDKRGVYEIADGKSTTFTGLYRVVGVTHNFDSGSFTQTLNMVRFKNQGIKISKPIEQMRTYSFKSGESYVTDTVGSAERMANIFRNTSIEIKSVENIFGKIKSFTKRFNNIKTKVRKFFS